MPAPQSSPGYLHHRDGRVERARLYHGAGESPARHVVVDPDLYSTWTEDDGAVGIRRGTSTSVGATPTYAAKYDAVDWGN